MTTDNKRECETCIYRTLTTNKCSRGGCVLNTMTNLEYEKQIAAANQE